MSHAIRGRVLSLSTSTAIFGGLLYAISVMRPMIVIFPEPQSPEPPPMTIQPFMPPIPTLPTHRQQADPVDSVDPVTLITTKLDPKIDETPPPITITPTAVSLTGATWLRKPTTEELIDFYPEVSLARGIGGRVVLDCIVSADGRINCTAVQETPAGKGFKEAALRASRLFKMAPMLADGRPTEGGRIQVPIKFDPPR